MSADRQYSPIHGRAAPGHRDPIFKGATRPAMVMGVPIVPFVLVGGAHVLIGMWILNLGGLFWLFVSLSAAVVEMLALRAISSFDEHRLDQLILHARWSAHCRNARTWGTHSMNPIELRWP